MSIVVPALAVVALVAAASSKKKQEVKRAFLVALEVTPTAPTIEMMRDPTPQPPSDEWNRWVKLGVTAGRSKMVNPNTGNAFGVPPTEIGGRPQLEMGRPVFVRVWAESRFSPVRDKYDAAAAFWSFGGTASPGAALPVIRNHVAVVGSGMREMTWISCVARVLVTGQLQVIFFYPGTEHHGKERGRDYDVVVEWRQA